jgi:glycerol-3-phosphate dehydrogenase
MIYHDLVIIGGGINGAACAGAAARHGLSCLLLEQYSRPAQGTSGRSSKLIHGGLRYLETGQISLVRESLVDRARLLQIYPDLVKLVPFHIPVYSFSKRRPWQIRIGLVLYQLLGGKGFQSVAKTEWHKLDGLRKDDLQAVFHYLDAQTDDAALTQAVLESAQQRGADIIMDACFIHAERQPQGYRIVYQLAGDSRECMAGVLINAAGPWVNQVLDQIQPAPARCEIDLVAGSHIVIPGRLQRGIYYLEAPVDKRAVFVQPWQDNILVGTTERIYQGPLESIQPDAEELEYLLGIYNHYFCKQMTTVDVIESFAGLRVLPVSKKSPFQRSRETIIQPDDAAAPRLFSIYGGKLTVHHATAEKLMQQVLPVLAHGGGHG